MFNLCHGCKITYPKEWGWFKCDTCSKHICQNCLAITGSKCEGCTSEYDKRK